MISCEICNKKFSSSRNLKNHIKKKHGKLNVDVQVPPQKTALKEEPIEHKHPRITSNFSKENNAIRNFWTSQDEVFSNEGEFLFYKKCVDNNDKVTKNHKIKIPWENKSGKIKFYNPEFVHLEEKIIYCFLDFKDYEDNLIFTGIKDWCSSNNFIVLNLKFDKKEKDIFVVGGFKKDVG